MSSLSYSDLTTRILGAAARGTLASGRLTYRSRIMGRISKGILIKRKEMS